MGENGESVTSEQVGVGQGETRARTRAALTGMGLRGKHLEGTPGAHKGYLDRDGE